MRLFPLLAMALMLCNPALADAEPATISVTGEGKVELAPDMAMLNVGVTTEADTATAALAANSEQIAAVLARLKAAGIAERDLQTSGLALNPRYDYNSGGSAPKLDGYSASNMVTVRLRDLTILGQTLDAVVSDGANTLGGLSFGLQMPDAATDEARRRAVADAARKANLYAEAAGVKLGPVVSITEQGGNFPSPVPMALADAGFAKEARSVPIASGELTVAATVSVVYALAP